MDWEGMALARAERVVEEETAREHRVKVAVAETAHCCSHGRKIGEGAKGAVHSTKQLSESSTAILCMLLVFEHAAVLDLQAQFF